MHDHVVTDCDHHFHRDCIDVVMREQGKCPLCRKRLDDSMPGLLKPVLVEKRPGVVVDEDPTIMEILLRVIYMGNYRLATEDFWKTSLRQAEGYELPRCFHWKMHLELCLMACRLEIDFLSMQDESMWMFGNLVREFANLQSMSLGYYEAARWRLEAEEILAVTQLSGLDDPCEQGDMDKLTQCVREAYDAVRGA